MIQGIPTGERMMMRTDFNRQVGDRSRGDEEGMDTFGVKYRNAEGQMVVDIA